MEEMIPDILQKSTPEWGQPRRFVAEVGEFPRTKLNSMSERLPLEEPDMFSTDPLDFEESTLALLEDVQEIYEYTQILNRFSDKYQKVSWALAKGLVKLASCCVTKAVLEKKGFRFPKIETLEIPSLFCVAAFNFRKCHTAIKETTNKNYLMWARLIEIEFGWHSLYERLIATEEKIRNIRSGKINVDSMIDRARMFLKRPASAKQQNGQSSQAARRPASYSFIGPVVREMTEKAKALQALAAEPVASVQNAPMKQQVNAGAPACKPVKPEQPATSPKKQREAAEQERRDQQYLDETAMKLFRQFQQRLERARSSEKVPVPIGSKSPGRA